MGSEVIASMFNLNIESSDMDCVLDPSPAPSLVIAFDIRDSPDVLQVKAHPGKLCLLSTSDVLSCNTGEPVSVPDHQYPGVEEG